MKKQLIILFTCIIYINSYAQVDFEDHNVTSNAEFPVSAFAADIDGDGDMDVLSASQVDDKIAWYENTDGLGTFGSQQVITTNVDGAVSVYAADIDGDGDMDVLSASQADDKIAWYENTDGQGNFGAQQLIATIDWPQNVISEDIDGDGDMDVLSDSWIEDKIVWYENTDGEGSFSAEKLITSDIDGTRIFCAGDLDNDGDLDLLSASAFDNTVAWYKNTDGLGNFGPQQIITTNPQDATSVFPSDIDGDGDLDVLSTSQSNGIISWYENTDGLGNFGGEQIITTNAGGAKRVCAADLDLDGDMDVLSTSYAQDVNWYENTDGYGAFGPQLEVSNISVSGAYYLSTLDMDGDGDVDVLTTSLDDNKITWYENLTLLGIHNASFVAFSVYPNPTYGALTIESQTRLNQINIYNQLGQIVYSNTDFSEENKNRIDISNLSQGIYFIKLINKDGIIDTKKIVKK